MTPDEISGLLEKIPDSPAGRQLRWYLRLLLTGGEDASLADRERYNERLRRRMRPAASDEDERQNWRGSASWVGEIKTLAVKPSSDFSIEADVASAKDRKWRLIFAVEEQPPHRISRQDWRRQFDSSIEVRKALESDGPALADIERRCPIVMGDKSMYFDRGDDYFAFARLMEEVTVGIAFLDGVPAAASCGAMHRIRIGGVVHPIVTVAHLRVLPEHQRKGLWGAVNRAFEHYFEQVDGSRAYISVENTGMQHGFTNTPNKWSIPVYRVQLSCAAMAGPPAGRAATSKDIPHIVAILNSCHGAEEQYLPHTEESFLARLSRAPRQYSCDRVWMTERAVVGVWPAGESLKVVSEANGIRTESRPAIVLDYGYEPGAEEDLEALLRAWCGWALRSGMDTLSIFTSDASPGCARLRSLARAVEPFFVWTPGIAEPPDSTSRGVYVDPVYF